MKIQEVLNKKLICFLQSQQKETALAELIDMVVQAGKYADQAELSQQIFHREKLMSTGIGLGIAIPHARIVGVKAPILAIGISKVGIADYGAIDDKVVQILCMIVVEKQQHKIHLQLLSQIVEILKNQATFDRIMAAGNVDVVSQIFCE